jgi:DNA primase large subunit
MESNSNVIEARRRDHVSHYLLRLYYCRNEELRRWFITVEHELFRFRLYDLVESSELSKFLEFNGLPYEKLAETENMFAKINWNNILKTETNKTTYKLPFEEALDLVRLRKVYLNNGYAYILAQDMITVVANKFRSDLSQSLAVSNVLSLLNKVKRVIF